MLTRDDFLAIVLNQPPLIDVRAPVEFYDGALPGATNYPILLDDERHQVGLCYRKEGKNAAIALGKKLVVGAVRHQRVAKWCGLIKDNPDTILYCSRGGLRSHIARDWIEAESGLQVHLIEGGYKSFRQFLLSKLNPSWLKSKPIIIGGRTGVGKTVVIRQLNNGIDLEAIANHRGSSFGNHISGQPSQADFENRLAVSLIKHWHSRCRHLVVEDEGRHVGKRFLPRDLSHFFSSGHLVVIEAALAERVERTYCEYVIEAQEQYKGHYGLDRGLQEWFSNMVAGVERIAKRLGPANYRKVAGALQRAWVTQQSSGETSGYKEWIELLLTLYYDPMYDFQLERDSRSVIFKGTRAAAYHYLQSLK